MKHYFLPFHVTALLFAVALSLPLHAEEILVSTISDAIAVDGRCTLREAISAANTDMAVNECPAGDGADTILLFFMSPHEITVAGANEDLNQTGDFDIRDDVTIRPSDPTAMVQINGGNLDRVFEVFDGVDLTLERIEVRGGEVVGFGGGIFVQQETTELELYSSAVSGNSSTLFGGGIYSEGFLLLSESRVSSNDSSFGGGVYMGTANPLILRESVIRGNESLTDGGGLNLMVLLAENSTISGNEAGRHGGGVAWRTEGTVPVVSQLTNSTVAENGSAEDGGGLYFDSPGTLELFNTTVAWNAADIAASAGGDGGGIFVASGIIRPQNSIFAANQDLSTDGSLVAPDCLGSIASLGYNLFAAVEPADCAITGNTTGDQVGSVGSPIDHGLDCLQTVDGLRIVPPVSSSPVIDAGNPAGCARPTGGSLERDQRNHLRPWDGPDPDQDARCDLGAIEFGAPSVDFIYADGFESGDVSSWDLVVGTLVVVGRTEENSHDAPAWWSLPLDEERKSWLDQRGDGGGCSPK